MIQSCIRLDRFNSSINRVGKRLGIDDHQNFSFFPHLSSPESDLQGRVAYFGEGNELGQEMSPLAVKPRVCSADRGDRDAVEACANERTDEQEFPAMKGRRCAVIASRNDRA